MKKKFLGLLLFLSAFFQIHAQKEPFYEEIENFKKLDKEQPPKPGTILFVGSSSFRFWTDLQKDFSGYPVLNRGFGGSSLPDVIHYANDIIFPYHPKQIVIYCGDNDLAASDTVTASMVCNRFITLFHLIRSRLPGEPIVFVSIKPSPSRERLLPKMKEANSLIRNFMTRQKHAAFVDVYSKMVNKDGKPQPYLFRQDQLHMKPEGYAIWQKAILPYLIK